MLEELLEALEGLFLEADDRDELIDLLQEAEPDELRDICANLWALELVVAYCKAKE